MKKSVLAGPALAREAGIESEDVVKAFEYGKSLPPEATWRKLEEALGWKLGISGKSRG